MLTEDEFDSWKSRLKLPEYTLTILEAVRSSDPSRQVHSGKSNVCGNYPSQKMGVTIQFESHRDELSHIVEKLEHGLDVLEYYDQPPPIELLYLSKKGKPVRCRHTPDFFVIRRNSAGWEECKAHEPSVEAPSEKRFRLEIQRRSGCEQTRVRQGGRAANQHKPFYSTTAMPRHGDLPWESAHIDHTQVDEELVSSLISLATCNSSSAISLRDINLGRPWATLMVDSYSKRILAVYLTYEEPSRRSCMMVMRICVQRFRRLPQIIVTDNGKEFHSIYFKQLLAYYRCTQKYRPPGEPRYGAPVERVFNTKNTQWVHELKGNTQILRKHRQVTKSVNPKGQAIWTLGEFYQFLEYWAYEIYDKREHSTLGQSPRIAFETGIALGGRREVRRIEYDETFRILTLPSPQPGRTRVVQPGRGVKIRNTYYWSDVFRDPEIEHKPVEVKYDPFNVSIAYALVKGRWEECISDHYHSPPSLVSNLLRTVVSYRRGNIPATSLVTRSGQNLSTASSTLAITVSSLSAATPNSCRALTTWILFKMRKVAWELPTSFITRLPSLGRR